MLGKSGISLVQTLIASALVSSTALVLSALAENGMRSTQSTEQKLGFSQLREEVLLRLTQYGTCVDAFYENDGQTKVEYKVGQNPIQVPRVLQHLTNQSRVVAAIGQRLPGNARLARMTLEPARDAKGNAILPVQNHPSPGKVTYAVSLILEVERPQRSYGAPVMDNRNQPIVLTLVSDMGTDAIEECMPGLVDPKSDPTDLPWQVAETVDCEEKDYADLGAWTASDQPSGYAVGDVWKVNWDFACGANEVITGVRSEWGGGDLDRRFKYTCCKLRDRSSGVALSVDQRAYTVPANQPKTAGSFECSGDRFYSAMSSWYSPGEGRVYRPACSLVSHGNSFARKGAAQHMGWANSAAYRDNFVMNCPQDHVLGAEWHIFNDGLDDRRFQFTCFQVLSR